MQETFAPSPIEQNTEADLQRAQEQAIQEWQKVTAQLEKVAHERQIKFFKTIHDETGSNKMLVLAQPVQESSSTEMATSEAQKYFIALGNKGAFKIKDLPDTQGRSLMDRIQEIEDHKNRGSITPPSDQNPEGSFFTHGYGSHEQILEYPFQKITNLDLVASAVEQSIEHATPDVAAKIEEVKKSASQATELFGRINKIVYPF